MGSNCTNKIWKEKPPGREQLLLDEMFENGSITVYATAESVRQSNDAFRKFPERTFAAHFRKTKARSGEFLSHAKGFPGGVVPSPPTIEKTDTFQIPELGSSFTPPPLKRQNSDKFEGIGEIVNPPYTCWNFTDHDLKTDYVCVALTIFAGSKKTTFEVSEDGLKLTAKFLWPTAVFSSAELFGQEIKDGTMSKNHPMIYSMASSMLQSGITANSSPEGQWTIPLPCKVQREEKSYEMTKVKSGTATILLIKFTAYQNDLIIEQANRTMTFD